MDEEKEKPRPATRSATSHSQKHKCFGSPSCKRKERARQYCVRNKKKQFQGKKERLRSQNTKLKAEMKQAKSDLEAQNAELSRENSRLQRIERLIACLRCIIPTP